MVVIVAAIGRITTEEICIIFRAHVTTAAPTLVAYSEIFDIPRLLTSVLTAEVSHRRVTVRGHIFHPFGEFLNSTRANVSTDVWFSPEHLAEIQKLVGTERVVLDSAAPVIVLHLWAL